MLDGRACLMAATRFVSRMIADGGAMGTWKAVLHNAKRRPA